MSLLKPLSSLNSHMLRLAVAGCVAGGLAGISGCSLLDLDLWGHEDEAVEWCDDNYGDCLADATSDSEREWCVSDVRYCYESCGFEWQGDDGDDGDDDGRADDGDWGDDDGRADDEGRADDGDDDGADDDGADDEGTETEGDDVCIELFGNCIDAAETLEDVEACEALFQQCIDPGECPGGCGCPADDLQACLDSYGVCSELADTPEKVDLCAAAFDDCSSPFADACDGEDHPNLEPCLEQHELCVACADTDEQFEACQTVFDSCLAS